MQNKSSLNSKFKINNSKLIEGAQALETITRRLDQWAELTALALDLHRSASALKKKGKWTEENVWQKMREIKEKAWTTDHS